MNQFNMQDSIESLKNKETYIKYINTFGDILSLGTLKQEREKDTFLGFFGTVNIFKYLKIGLFDDYEDGVDKNIAFSLISLADLGGFRFIEIYRNGSGYICNEVRRYFSPILKSSPTSLEELSKQFLKIEGGCKKAYIVKFIYFKFSEALKELDGYLAAELL